MAVTYKKLWKLLIDKDMKKKELASLAGINPTTISVEKVLAKPGDTVSFEITQGDVKGYESKNYSVSGFDYGYSLENDNIKDGDNKTFSNN